MLCLDEFLVSDIGDVMILVNLFDVLFVCGVSLVIIFNIVLVYLYCDGL